MKPRMSAREKVAQMVCADFRFELPDYERITDAVPGEQTLGESGPCLVRDPGNIPVPRREASAGERPEMED